MVKNSRTGNFLQEKKESYKSGKIFQPDNPAPTSSFTLSPFFHPLSRRFPLVESAAVSCRKPWPATPVFRQKQVVPERGHTMFPSCRITGFTRQELLRLHFPEAESLSFLPIALSRVAGDSLSGSPAPASPEDIFTSMSKLTSMFLTSSGGTGTMVSKGTCRLISFSEMAPDSSGTFLRNVNAAVSVFQYRNSAIRLS